MSFSYHMLNFLRSTQCLLSLEQKKKLYMLKQLICTMRSPVYDNKNVCKYKTGKKKLCWIINKWMTWMNEGERGQFKLDRWIFRWKFILMMRARRILFLKWLFDDFLFIFLKWNRKLNDVYIQKLFSSLFKDIIKEDYVGEFFN